MAQMTFTVPKAPVKNGKVVITEERAIVLFWSSGCGHCIRYKPTFQKLYQSLGNSNVYQVHCPDNMAVCSAYQIMGYPTIKYWRNGAIHDCPLSRDDIAGLKQWVNGKSGGGRRRKSSAKSTRRKSARRKRSSKGHPCRTHKCGARTANGTKCSRQCNLKRCWQHK